MKQIMKIVALGVFGLSTTVHAADDEPIRNRLLNTLDTDGDGSVSFAEFQSGGDQRLARLDDDGDGFVSLDEYLGRAANPARGRRGNGNAERQPSEEQIARMEQRRAAMIERATARFHEMDNDGDTLISLDEYQEANFLALDEDNNGVLSAQEIRPKRGGRRGGPGQRGNRTPRA